MAHSTNSKNWTNNDIRYVTIEDDDSHKNQNLKKKKTPNSKTSMDKYRQNSPNATALENQWNEIMSNDSHRELKNNQEGQNDIIQNFMKKLPDEYKIHTEEERKPAEKCRRKKKDEKFDNQSFLYKLFLKALKKNPEKYQAVLELPEKVVRNSSQEEMTKKSRHKKKIFPEVPREGATLGMNAKEKWIYAISRVICANRAVGVFKKVENDIVTYGAKLMLEESSIQTEFHFIIHPDSKFKAIWNSIQSLLLVYTATFVPYKIAFIDSDLIAIEIIDWIVDILFALDIVINFLSGYRKENNDKEIVFDKIIIAKKYLSSWFIFDLFVVFPFQFILTSDSGDINGLIRLVRLPRLYRLFRIVKLMKMMTSVGKGAKFMEKIIFKLIVHNGLLRLFQTLITLLLFVHIFGCAYYLLAKMYDLGPETWPVKYGFIDSSNGELYLASIHFILQTLTTVGYGDMPPSTTPERIFTLLLMVFGAFLYSYTIGVLMTILSSSNVREEKLVNKFIQLNEYSQKVKLPEDLTMKMKRILERKHDTINIDEEEILNEFPLEIKAQAMIMAHAKTFNQIKCLKGKDPNFILSLISMIQQIKLEKNEIIYREGAPAEEIYFIVKGRIRLANIDGYVFKTWVEGSIFGETELLLDKNVRNCSAVVGARQDCHLLLVKKDDFLKLLDQYPQYKEEFTQQSKEKEENVEESVTAAIKLNYMLPEEIIQKISGGLAKSGDLSMFKPKKTLFKGQIKKEGSGNNTPHKQSIHFIQNEKANPSVQNISNDIANNISETKGKKSSEISKDLEKQLNDNDLNIQAVFWKKKLKELRESIQSVLQMENNNMSLVAFMDTELQNFINLKEKHSRD